MCKMLIEFVSCANILQISSNFLSEGYACEKKHLPSAFLAKRLVKEKKKLLRPGWFKERRRNITGETEGTISNEGGNKWNGGGFGIYFPNGKNFKKERTSLSTLYVKLYGKVFFLQLLAIS